MTNMLLMIGTTELILIAGLALLLFGGKKLPEMMRGMGQGVKSFKEGLNSPTEEDKKETKADETMSDDENKEESEKTSSDNRGSKKKEDVEEDNQHGQ